MAPRLVALIASALVLLGAPALAQPPQLSQAQVQKLVGDVEDLTRAHYFSATKRGEVIAVLEASRNSGRYTGNAAEVAAKISEDIGRASGDRHVYITWRPDQAKALAEASRAGKGDEEDTEFNHRTARARNHGLAQMRVLPGNIRYMEIDGFLWDGEPSKRAYDDAMRFLAGGEAIVIDIRGNGGGSPEAVNYLTSHFVDPGTLLMRFVMAGGEERSVSQGPMPAGSLKGKPLYVLIGPRVGSAAEEFASHVQKFKLGELVGQTTAGAGNRNDLFPIEPGFVLSLSVGAALHGTDGKGWEAVGVPPSIVIDPDLALERAQLAALTRLIPTATAEDARAYAWAIEGLKVVITPVSVPIDQLRQYAGQFGQRAVRFEANRLLYQRPDGSTGPLTPMGGDLFQLGPVDSGVRVRFERGPAGPVTVLQDNGQSFTYPRTG